MSLARVMPTMRSTRGRPPEPGIWPMVISGSATSVSLVAMRKSQASASSQPTPKAYFSNAAITGLGQRSGAPMFQARGDLPSRCTLKKPRTSPPEATPPFAPRGEVAPRLEHRRHPVAVHLEKAAHVAAGGEHAVRTTHDD